MATGLTADPSTSTVKAKKQWNYFLYAQKESKCQSLIMSSAKHSFRTKESKRYQKNNNPKDFPIKRTAL